MKQYVKKIDSTEAPLAEIFILMEDVATYGTLETIFFWMNIFGGFILTAFVYVWPMFFMAWSILLGMFKPRSVGLMSGFVRNGSFFVKVLIVISLLGGLVMASDKTIYTYYLLFYLPFAAALEFGAWYFGVDAIRRLDPTWNETQGLLFPGQVLRFGLAEPFSYDTEGEEG